MGNRRTGLSDPFALHQYFAGRRYPARLDIQKAGGMQHYWRGVRFGLRWCATQKGQKARGKGEEIEATLGHGLARWYHFCTHPRAAGIRRNYCEENESGRRHPWGCSAARSPTISG
jgi:hypothetical protein